MDVQVMDGVLNDRAAQAVVVISTKPDCFIAGADVKSVTHTHTHTHTHHTAVVMYACSLHSQMVG